MPASKHVFYTLVDVIDEKVFTKDKVQQWKYHLLDSYENVFTIMKSKIDSNSPISFFLDRALVDEVIADAIIGMKKIVDSKSHAIESPNAFKIASYLAYWWLRHKPVSIHYPADYNFEKMQPVGVEHGDMEEEQKLTVWRLKHINELAAVQIVVSYIFRFDKVLCGEKECKHIKKEDKNFYFSSYDEMKTEILYKLTYYFSYRAIAPKVIEHILEGYTFHPAWGLAGNLWVCHDKPNSLKANEE